MRPDYETPAHQDPLPIRYRFHRAGDHDRGGIVQAQRHRRPDGRLRANCRRTPDGISHHHGMGAGPRNFRRAKKANSRRRSHSLPGLRRKSARYPRADFAVCASLTYRIFPLALCEARAAGCAVLGTAVGGVPELLENGAAGLLVPPYDPAALANAFRRVLKDPAELAKWKEAASSNLDWLQIERMTLETMSVYQSVLDERRARRKRIR